MKYFQVLAQSNSPGSKDWGYLPYIFILLSNITWAGSFIYSNEHRINVAQFTLVRGLTCLIINYVVCRMIDSQTDFKLPRNFRVLSLRAAVMIIHGFCFALSQFILPLPIVHTIGCSGTLFVFIFDYILNSIKINSKQAIGIVIGLIGALMATNGQVLTIILDPQYQYSSKFQNYLTTDHVLITIFSIVFMGSMVLWAIGIVITKRATANTFQINFILGVYLAFAGALAYPYLQIKCTGMQLFLSIFFTSVPMIFGQWFFIGALMMTKQTGVLNMLNFVSIIFAYLVSIFRYNQPPNLITNVGILLVFFGVWKTVFNKSSQKVEEKTGN